MRMFCASALSVCDPLIAVTEGGSKLVLDGGGWNFTIDDPIDNRSVTMIIDHDKCGIVLQMIFKAILAALP